jgi:hypothetical protein
MARTGGNPDIYGKGEKFTKKRQPSPEAKKEGWAKRKRGTELVRLILEMKFIGAKDHPLRQAVADFFGVKENDITNEQILHFRQIQKAVLEGDTTAYKAIIERGYGQPTQTVETTEKVVFRLTKKTPKDGK